MRALYFLLSLIICISSSAFLFVGLKEVFKLTSLKGSVVVLSFTIIPLIYIVSTLLYFLIRKWLKLDSFKWYFLIVLICNALCYVVLILARFPKGNVIEYTIVLLTSFNLPMLISAKIFSIFSFRKKILEISDDSVIDK